MSIGYFLLGYLAGAIIGIILIAVISNRRK